MGRERRMMDALIIVCIILAALVGELWDDL